ncbi:T9SS type A sorting domain-containing protein [Dyadobacter sp. CY323]|uniref:T9SS type A sorting domain-containing protein n=1 Tax=Dyadobacter sp. CY323 TaxID=2907302 RepID=UPI001F279441|nr:T9SS type A sorting domain-containing protein [Dyadobacter sp. CY323]MCE6989457.1 T9SS type A sorting domain-containing protein [Dyadobacter sp. CY323]
MKHLFKCERGKLCGFLLLVTLLDFSSSLAQDYQQQRQDQIKRLDLKGLGNTLLLNLGVISQNENDYFKILSKDKDSRLEKVTSEEWQNLYERLTDADLRSGTEHMPALSHLIEDDPYKVTRSNVVPIGIMNLRSIYMSGSQIADNEAQKKAGNPVNYSAYERFDIVYAAVLQEDIYQAEVAFRISPELFITNHAEKPERIELNFNDGQGYKAYPVSNDLIQHRFESIGEQKIGIRLLLNDKTFLFETKVNVRQLERIKPYKEFQVTAERISKDTLADTSARTMLVGGNIRIILGCDQVLNKPIIIGERFDMGQDITLDVIEGNYRTPLGRYLTEGYDLVLLDYSDPGAAMEDNAQVLKALIQQVNQMKTGNAQSIVIGESMSGLVARWALRQMENEGIAHQVKLLICYDTPHQGANVPVGLTQLLLDAHPTFLSQVILKFLGKKLRSYYGAHGTPAAKRMLLHWGGHLTGGVGSKHPAFDTFRSQLTALGNGGYPQNCRNIAVIHGSMDASDRKIFDQYNYGSRIIRGWTPLILQTSNIDVHTNELGQNSNVLRFLTWGSIFKTAATTRKYNSPVNDDFLPGGKSAFPIPNKFFKETSSFDFCFVPTFSSIDYKGPRATQAERELLNVTATDIAQTPFAAIYGDNENTVHVSTRFANLIAMGLQENLLTNIPACPDLPVPPIPFISTYNTCYPFSQKRSTEDNTANITVSLATPTNSQFIHNWTVLPTQQAFTTTDDQITFQAERPGEYQIICVRTYPNRRDLQSTSTITMTVDDCGNAVVAPENPDPSLVVSPDINVTDIWEGDFLLTTEADSTAVFAHYTPAPKILYATLDDGSFIPKSTLEASGMFPEFAALFTETDPRIALPVTLKEFHAKVEGKTGAPAAGTPAAGSPAAAILTWTTSAEFNSDHFEIERSKSGKEWEKIAIVPASAFTAQEAAYAYADLNPPFNVAYYRLKMVDQDSTFAYSRVEVVRFDGGREIAVFPNPIDQDGHLQILPAGNLVSDVKIYNASGKLVFQSDQPENQVNVKDLPVGRYIVKIRLKDGSQTSRAFVKQ